MKKAGKIVVAMLVAVVLAVLGISQIGGETWVETAAQVEVRAFVPPIPRPTYPPELVPATLLIGLGVASALYWFLSRRAKPKAADDPANVRDE